MVTGQRETVELTLTVEAETAKAYLVSDGVTEGWLPKSLLQDESPIRQIGGQTFEFEVPAWWATKQEFI